MIKFYTTDCPKCKILKDRLEKANMDYEEIDSLPLVVKKAGEVGIISVPFCEMNDGSIKNFSEMMEILD